MGHERSPGSATRSGRCRGDRPRLDDRRRALRRVRPAAAAAGSGLLIGLALAAVVAYCNATSSARLAARLSRSPAAPTSTAASGSAPFWGYLAGWSFVVGKTASCAAMALTVGVYVWPAHAHAVAVAAVVALTALNCFGVQQSALLTPGDRGGRAGRAGRRGGRVRSASGAGDAARLGIGGDATRRAACCSRPGCCSSPSPATRASPPWAKRSAIRPARSPARSRVALAITLVVYAAVAVARSGRSAAPASRRRPRRCRRRRRGRACRGWSPVVRVGAAVAALGLAAGADPRGVAHDAGHGARPAPAAAAGRGASRASGARTAPRSPSARWSSSWPPRGPARRDRLLVVRRAGVLRDRQRVGLDLT